MYGRFDNEHGMSGMWVFGLLGLVLLLGIVLLVVLAVRDGPGFGRRASSSITAEGPQQPRRDDPRQVLDHRYARGELDTEEYRERVKTLGEHV